MKKESILVLVMVVLLFGSASTNSAKTASFQGLGCLPESSESYATDVSADGSVVVGFSASALGWYPAFCWTASDGMQSLGDLAGGDFMSMAYEVSANGSVVVGRSSSASGEICEAFCWTESGGMMGLGFLPSGDLSSASAVSANGSVVVGFSNSAAGEPYEAFRWFEAGGMQVLGDLPGGDFWSEAYAVSADGLVVVGTSHSASGHEAFRWIESQGMEGLGELLGGEYYSRALGVSADSLVIVGESKSISGWEAFRWENGTMIGLGDLSGGEFWSAAYDVSADGSIVVGKSGVEGSGCSSKPPDCIAAFIWDAVNGMRNLKEVLEGEYGLDLTGWELWEATGISCDGLTIVGTGRNPDRYIEAWIATISKPPIKADVAITPDTLNLKSKGKWISCRIWLTEDYNVADIDPNSILLEEEIPAGWVGLEGQAALVKFSRQDVCQMLAELDVLGQVELTVSGELIDGTRFEGTDAIKVIDKGKKK